MSIYKELAFDTVCSKVKGVQFSLLSEEEILRRSVVEVTENQAFTGNEPVPNGLFDPRMGVIDNNRVCQTCQQSNTFCPGHFGHIVLARPVFYVQFFDIVRKLMRCVCFRCSRLLVDLEGAEARSILGRKISRQRRWDLMTKLAMKVRRCGSETVDGCGAKMPDKVSKTDDMRLRMRLYWKELDSGGGPREVFLNAEDVFRVLRRVTDAESEALGLCPRFARPEWMICTVLPVPPPCVRPSVRQDGGQRQEDDLTHKLSDIVKTNNLIQKNIRNGATHDAVESTPTLLPLLQYHVSTLIDNSLPSMHPSKDRAGRMLRSLTERLKHKEGRIRGNLMGKRVDFSARTVITPDPNLSIDELGVPLKIAMNLTFPEVVGPTNRAELQRLVLAGPDFYPGAKQVRLGSRTVRLRGHPDRAAIVLNDGDVVERHLRNGDYVLFNRQPSLHKMSMMGHRVRVMDFNTFRLNVCVCSSYNADFDGDEMNMHVPQSLLTHYEIQKLASVPMHVLSPKTSKPIITIVQDVALGVFRLTQPDVSIPLRQVFNLVTSFDVHPTSVSAGLDDDDADAWSGRRVLSCVLPPTTNLHMHTRDPESDRFDPDVHVVRIRRGQIESGVLTSGVYGAGSRGLVHSVYNTLGPTAVTSMLNATQKLVCGWLVSSGFSVGISDLVLPKAVTEEQKRVIAAAKKSVLEVIASVHEGSFENVSTKSNSDYLEELIKDQRLAKGYQDVEKLGMASAARGVLGGSENRMLNMIVAGSKGKEHNFTQMTGCLGQQDIEGRRVPDGYDGRTLPHYTRYDDRPEARGFVESSFITGLTPQEFFFHAMAGRIGLINTAVRTSETGYLQRRLIKAMEDCKVHYDGTVRAANGSIIQFLYGEDGMDAIKLEHQSISTMRMSIPEVMDAYLLSDPAPEKAERIEAHVRQILEDRKALIMGLCEGLQVHDKAVTYPVNIGRIVSMVMDEFGPSRADVVDPIHVIDEIDALSAELDIGIPVESGPSSRPQPKWMPLLLRAHLSPKRLGPMSREAFDEVVSRVRADFRSALVNPGEMVGIVAAQSIGEISTQLTLDTFHTSGIASFGKVTSGIPRMKELMSVSKKIKTPAMYVTLRREWATSFERANAALGELETTFFRDIVSKSAIFFDPEDDAASASEQPQRSRTTTVAEDDAWVGFESSLPFKQACPAAKNFSPWLLRFEFDRERMLDRQVTMIEVELALHSFYDAAVSCIVTDDNASLLACRLRLSTTASGASASATDLFGDLRALEQSIMDHVVIKGIAGINRARPQKPMKLKRYDPVAEAFVENDEWTIVTTGSNLLEVMNHPTIDFTRTTTNDVYETMNVLGIEAARQLLLEELRAVNGQPLDHRHLSLLVDTMSTRGTFMSIDRHGINHRGELGPLAKCSFEQTTDMLLKAGIFGERDVINGVSANTMLGQVAQSGTGNAQVLLDCEFLKTRGRPAEPPPEATPVTDGRRRDVLLPSAASAGNASVEPAVDPISVVFD